MWDDRSDRIASRPWQIGSRICAKMNLPLLLLSFLLAGSTLHAEEPVLIAHPGNPVATLSLRDLGRIYFNKKVRWSDGSSILPVILQEGKTHDSFLEDLLGKNERQFSVFWNRLLFTGKGVPPTSFASEQEVIAFVSANPGAIGYVSDKADLEGVKRIEIRGKSP